MGASLPAPPGDDDGQVEWQPVESQPAAAQSGEEMSSDACRNEGDQPAAVQTGDENSGAEYYHIGESVDSPAQGQSPEHCGPQVPLDDLKSWISAQAAIRRNVSFRGILKSHLFRSKALGGPICEGNIRDYVRCETLSENCVEATVTLPVSFSRLDAAACGASAIAKNETEATEAACKGLVLELLVRDAVENYPNCQMRLIQNNWKCVISSLMQHTRSFIGAIDAGVVGGGGGAESMNAEMHADGERSSSKARAHYVQPAAHEVDKRNEEIEILLIDISVNELNENATEWAGLDRLKQFWRRDETDGWRKVKPFEELRRLVEPGGLLKFLQDRPTMFEVEQDGKKLRRFRHIMNPMPQTPASFAEPDSVQPAAPVRSEPRSSRDHTLPPQRDQSTSVSAAEVVSILDTISEDEAGWAVPGNCNANLETRLWSLINREYFWQFILDRPDQFQVDMDFEGRNCWAFRSLQNVQPAAHTVDSLESAQPAAREPFAGNCICGGCQQQWFEQGWTCTGF